jgi:hypothetical protein
VSTIKDLVHLPPWELRDWLLITEAQHRRRTSKGEISISTGAVELPQVPVLVLKNRAKTCKDLAFDT